MADRYIVTTIVEARASGKRAAGFCSERDAERGLILLAVGSTVPNSSDWWTIAPGDTHAIVDTATAADGSPGESERRPVYADLRNTLDALRAQAGFCPYCHARFYAHTDLAFVRCAHGEGAR